MNFPHLKKTLEEYSMYLWNASRKNMPDYYKLKDNISFTVDIDENPIASIEYIGNITVSDKDKHTYDDGDYYYNYTIYQPGAKIVIHYKNKSTEIYESWSEYDDSGNEIYIKGSNGNEKWLEYDDNGNLIHSKDNEGEEVWTEYNANGKMIHYKKSGGYEAWYDYDDSGNPIHFKNTEDYEKWREYGGNGNLIYSKDSDGYEEWNEYDESGKKIHCKTSNDTEYWYEYTYWKNGTVRKKTEYETR